MNYPKISVITVVLNDGKTIERTIKSVIKQTYNNLEYIVIDGKSTDETLDIIKKYKDEIDYFVSQSDKGMYDAMNKGVKASTGDVIYFLNGDDCLLDENVIKDIATAFSKNNEIDYVYGGIYYENPYKTKNFDLIIKEEVKDEDFPKGKMIRHQALFVKREVFKEVDYFNTNLKIASDLEFEYKMSRARKKGLFIDRIIAKMSSDGVSANINACLKEKTMLMEKYFGGKIARKYKYYRIIKNAALFLAEKTGLAKPILVIRKNLGKTGTLH